MQFNNVLELVGMIVPILSALASLFNGKERAAREAGVAVSPLVAKAGAVLNVGALNFDKAMQLVKAVKAALPEKDGQAAPKGE